MILAAEQDELQSLLEQSEQAYRTFRPRPDQPDRFDQQTGFANSNTTGVAWMIGGNGAGCLAAEQEVYDPVRGMSLPVSQIDRPFHVLARNALGQVVIAKANRPRIYGISDLYEITLSNGRRFMATAAHRILTAGGEWREIRELLSADRPLVGAGNARRERQHRSASMLSTRTPNLFQRAKQSRAAKGDRRDTIALAGARATIRDASAQLSAVPHGFGMGQRAPSSSRTHGALAYRTAEGSTDRYSMDHRLCGEQPLSRSDIGRESSPSQVDARERIPSLSPLDVSGISQECTPTCRSTVHHSRSRSAQAAHPAHAAQFRRALQPCSRPFGLAGMIAQGADSSMVATAWTPEGPRSPAGSFPSHTSLGCHRSATENACASDAPLLAGIKNTAYITSIRFLRTDSYWDFSVEDHENYWMEGVFHHNTTEISLHKLARFVLSKQPPPRKDTPFWIIANTYEQVCKAAWKEKLIGHGHIPNSEVQWDAIRWYKENQGWPYEVPLKPWPGMPGRNWTLSFKSYKQGRAQMQAESVGGFCFIEQFPWNLLEEVLRGCREYNFPGSKFCEFTPIDPALSIEIEEMIENGHAPKDMKKASRDRRYLPNTWEIYRANTQCALEAGHVDRAWFEEFYGMISDEMTDTRLTGAFASYKGQIYQGYRPAIHLADDDAFEFPEGAVYRRSFDFGAGPANAFCCLWGYRIPDRWFIFDEYYVTHDRTIGEHADNIRERDEMYALERPGSYGDPSGAQWMNEFASQGIPISPARNDVLPGIESVRVALKKSIATKQPGLIIHRQNCPNLVRQMRTYRWEDASETGINPRDARLQPLKKDDHAVDALRYMIHTDRMRNGVAPTVTNREADPARHGINMEFGRREYLLNGRR